MGGPPIQVKECKMHYDSWDYRSLSEQADMTSYVVMPVSTLYAKIDETIAEDELPHRKVRLQKRRPACYWQNERIAEASSTGFSRKIKCPELSSTVFASGTRFSE